MADFDRAYDATMVIEGGYSNDPNDTGGETWRGISRRFHPMWPGWMIIDTEKADDPEGFEKRLMENGVLQQVERLFYKEEFWHRFDGNTIPYQTIADELFDTAVNMGVHKAVSFLQEALNLLNRNQKNYPDIIEDGVFGPTTMEQLRTHLAHENGSSEALLKVMNTLQGMHYITVLRAHPEQETYTRGWLKRT